MPMLYYIKTTPTNISTMNVSGDRDLYLPVPVRLRDAGAALPAQALHHRVPGVNRVKEKEVKMTIYDHMIMIF